MTKCHNNNIIRLLWYYYEICIFSFTEHPGNWNTGSEGVLELDSSTGVARAVSSGRAVIYHKVDDTVDTHTEVSMTYDHINFLDMW